MDSPGVSILVTPCDLLQNTPGGTAQVTINRNASPSTPLQKTSEILETLETLCVRRNNLSTRCVDTS